MVENIDATIIAQKPKMRPYIAQMEETIAETLGISPGQVNVKATTEEGLGFTGTEQGISAQAICALTSFYEGSSIAADSAAGSVTEAILHMLRASRENQSIFNRMEPRIISSLG